MTREKIVGIYVIRNTVTGKVYVGSSSDVHRRWQGHRSGLSRGISSCPRLQAAWTEHGAGVFSFEVVEIVPGRALLAVREQAWIDKLNSFDGGYNGRPRAGSGAGHQVSDETRAKMATAMTGRRFPPESIERMRAAATARERRYREDGGRKVSAETRAKMSASAKGPHPPQAIANMRAAQQNRSDETIERIRAGAVAGWKHRDRVVSDQARAKISAAGMGRVYSPATIEKMRTSALARRARERAARADST